MGVPESPADAVLRDLVDCVIQEQLAPVTTDEVEPVEPAGAGECWGRVGSLRVRLRPGGALQRWRLAGGPVLDPAGRPVGPAEAVAVMGLGVADSGAEQLVGDLVTAVAHARVVAEARGRTRTVPRPGDMTAGERLAVRRGRPFHPTGRAVSGWTAADLAAYGPVRDDPLGLCWVAVRRDHLRLGPGHDAHRLHERVLGPGELDRLRNALDEAGLDEHDHQLLPVHPWQAEHVLPRAYAEEYDRASVIPIASGLGRFHPTASLRTLVVAAAPDRHVKLPLGVATLGATRLLPPRYLDNGDRAERTMRAVVAGDPVLTDLVTVCAEGDWVGWADPSGDDEFADRPGHLAAQVRTYPAGTLDDIAIPMAALATDGWAALGPALGVDDPVAFFGRLADAFTLAAVAFLRHGVLPELHGQNVVVRLAAGGVVVGFVLRDHDTLRLFPDWMRAAGVPAPAYRLRPGGSQSLRLDSGPGLVGYLQTLGFQVNLYGIADALARHHGLDERALWTRLRCAVERALATPDLPPDVARVLADTVLRSPHWPSRTVLGPLLAAGRSSGVSMPAGTATVGNPLLATLPAEVTG